VAKRRGATITDYGFYWISTKEEEKKRQFPSGRHRLEREAVTATFREKKTKTGEGATEKRQMEKQPEGEKWIVRA